MEEEVLKGERKMNKSQLRTDIEMAINRNSGENSSDTPDFILAEYLTTCLDAFDKAVKDRSAWYGHHCTIGGCNHLPEKILVPESEREVHSDSPCFKLFSICSSCKEPYNTFGCQEGICHAPPKMPDTVKDEVITGNCLICDEPRNGSDKYWCSECVKAQRNNEIK